MSTKKYGILYALYHRCIFSVIALSLMVIVTIITVDSGYGSENIQAIKDDGNCDGPDRGVSPNDSDNTFRSLAVHSTDPDTVIFGNDNGFFRSSDGGRNWSQPNAGLYYSEGFEGGSCIYPEIYQIIYDSDDPTKLYAATTGGPGAASTPLTQIAGPYYSLDGGNSWTQSVGGLHNYAVTAIAQDPSNSHILYIGLDNAPATNTLVTESTSGPNIYKSTDGGLTWTGLTLPVDDNRIHNILVDPTNSNTVYCSGFNTSYSNNMDSHHLGFAKSTDGGTNWNQINNSLDSLREPFLSLDPNNPSTLYASVWTDEGAKAYKSTDRGENWALFSSSGLANNLAELKVSPFNSNILIGYCSNGICSTTDGGSSWALALDLRGSDLIFNDIEFTSDPNIVYASTDHLKIFKSVDGGATFSESDSTFAPTVTTGSATSVSSDSATLNGTVNPNGQTTTYCFEYGVDTSYGSTTSSASAGSGNSAISVNAAISGLTSDTTYHYRLVATNSSGTSNGDDKTFSTTIIYVESTGSCGGNILCYTTIQEGIDAVSSGAIIRIAEEVYDEGLIIDTDSDLILQGGWDPTFTTQSSNTVINSLTITGTGGPVEIENAVLQ